MQYFFSPVTIHLFLSTYVIQFLASLCLEYLLKLHNQRHKIFMKSKGPFTPSVSVNAATNEVCDSVLIENNGVAPEWVCNLFSGDSTDLNENRIASIIPELSQR